MSKLDQLLDAITDAARESKATAHYTSYGTAAEHCGNCAHYLGDGVCDVVQGQIKSVGWCRHWRHRT